MQVTHSAFLVLNTFSKCWNSLFTNISVSPHGKSSYLISFLKKLQRVTHEWHHRFSHHKLTNIMNM